MYFTLAVSAPDATTCEDLTRRGCATDPRTLPIPGPARVAWRAPDGRAALLTWGPGAAEGATRSAPGTIRAGDEAGGTVTTSTSITRVDPVYLARAGRAVVISDRASWVAAVTGRIESPDPLLYAGLLGPGYPLGAITPFAGVRALAPGASGRATGGVFTEARRPPLSEPGAGGPEGAQRLAAALVEAVTPLRDAAQPVELSLTGGKDSRLIAAALAEAKVPTRARTYGFADHPDVVVAAQVARELGLDHEVAEPKTSRDTGSRDGEARGAGATVQEVDVLARLRAGVLVADGMLSAFENVGRPDPDPADAAVAIGGHGGELLRGGYAKPIGGSAARRAAASAEMFRRLTMRRVPLLRVRWRTAYVATVAPWTVAVAARPGRTLDDFYLVNRAGRWSAAARQAYAIRSVLAQPFFDDQVVRAARAVPLAERLDDRLVRGAIRALYPPLADLPLAADQWKCGPAVAPVTAPPGSAPTGSALAEPALAEPALAEPALAEPALAGGRRARFDWRRSYGDEVATFLRDYVLGTGADGGLFAIVSRPAAEKLLRVPHTDPTTVWALATLATLCSGDWLNARQETGQTFAIPVPG
jgi:Asparagine synthase